MAVALIADRRFLSQLKNGNNDFYHPERGRLGLLVIADINEIDKTYELSYYLLSN